jgi:hypothetical protein
MKNEKWQTTGKGRVANPIVTKHWETLRKQCKTSEQEGSSETPVKTRQDLRSRIEQEKSNLCLL